jgi:ribose-phosphate pyrophosphokinase
MITFKAKTASGEIINSALSPFSFPAGEAHIKREEQRELEPTEIAIIQPDANSIHDDLFALAMWDDYLTRENRDLRATPEKRSKRVLVLPYMPGARADRGTPFGLSVYADFIRNLELNQIILFDPHSGATGDELHAAAEELTIVHSDELFDQVTMRAVLNQYTGIIAPDKGASRSTALILRASTSSWTISVTGAVLSLDWPKHPVWSWVRVGNLTFTCPMGYSRRMLWKIWKRRSNTSTPRTPTTPSER